LTQDIGFDQVERLEKCVGMYIDGKFTDAGFVDMLTKKFDAGGPEIGGKDANLFSTRIDTILKEAREIRVYRDNFKARVASPRQADRIAEIRNDLMRECHFTLHPEQIPRMDELLKFRIRGFIQQEDMRRRLEANFENDGIGIGSDGAREVSRYLEKLLGQGMYL